MAKREQCNLKKVSVCKGLRGFVSNRDKPIDPSPKRRVGRSNRLAGASSGENPSENPKGFRFSHNHLEFEGGRFILHFKGGRFILSDSLIVVAVPLKSNCILSAP